MATRPQPVTADGALAAAVADRALWAIMAVAALLLFWSLGGRCLWQDEAETARLGENVIYFGVPLAYDGRNVISQEVGKEFGADYFWRWSPWVQFYLAALSLNYLGHNTVAARLPFALLGLFTVPATYVLARRLFASTGVARLSTVLLALSVPFLLHARQCRWHAPAYLLALLVLLFLLELMDMRHPGRRWAYFAGGFVTSAALLFYTNYFTAVAFLAGVVLAIPLVRPDRRFLIRMVPLVLAIGVLITPGFVYFTLYVMRRSAPTQAGLFGQQLGGYLASFCYFLVSPAVLLLLAYILVRERGATWLTAAPLPPGDPQPQSKGMPVAVPNDLLTWRRAVLLPGVVCLMYVVVLCLGPWAFFRYLSVLLPLGAILTAVPIYWLWQRARPVAVLTVALLLFTDSLSLPTLALVGNAEQFPRYRFPADRFVSLPLAHHLNLPLVGYLCELAHPPRDAIWAFCDYLRVHSDPNDKILVSYGDLPLQFYTRCLVTGGLQGQRLLGAPEWMVPRKAFVSSERGKDLSVLFYIQETFNHSTFGPEWRGDVRAYVIQAIDPGRYAKIELPEMDLLNSASPEPRYHRFQIPPPPDERLQATIFRRWDVPAEP